MSSIQDVQHEARHCSMFRPLLLMTYSSGMVRLPVFESSDSGNNSDNREGECWVLGQINTGRTLSYYTESVACPHIHLSYSRDRD